jgi:hypothetical protein
MSAPQEWQAIMNHLESSGGNITADVETIIEQLSDNVSSINWVIGDVLVKAGTSASNIEYFTKVGKYGKSTLYSYAQTCTNFHPSMRWALLEETQTLDGDTTLSFNHFRACNTVLEDYGEHKAIEVLRMAADESWSIAQMRRYIATEIHGKEPKTQYKKLHDITADAIRNESSVHFITQDPCENVHMSDRVRIVVYEIIENES